MNYRILNYVCRLVALALVAITPVTTIAQNTARTAAKTAAEISASKWDIFIGYSYLSPVGKISGVPSGAPGSTYGEINWGGIASVSRYFNKNLGVQIEGDSHIQSEDWPAGSNNASYNSNDDFSGGSAGLIYRIPTAHFSPFVHVLGGAERVGSIYQVDTWNPLATGGGGLDYNTALLHHHLAFRIFQADYQHVFMDTNAINSFRLSTGVVFHIGTFVPPVPVTLSLAVVPDSVFPGDPVTATATAANIDPKSNVIYSWSGVAGATGNGAVANISTASLAPGTYTLKSEVREGKSGKEGLKPWQYASASATLTVKPFEPPTISCSATPNTIKPGDTATITASAVSPQNRSLVYTYAASAGAIAGNGNSATFSSNGAPTGDVKITCGVSDDAGQSVLSYTTLTILSPVLAAAPHAQALCSIAFNRDTKRPARVDNEAKACLDDTAMNLQKQPDSRLVLVGESTPDEVSNQKHAGKVAAQRAVNTKEYLVVGKGIDPSRITVVTGTNNGMNVEEYLVPAGADFNHDVQGTTSIDETEIKAQTRNK